MASASLASPGGVTRPMFSGRSGPVRYANAQDLPSYPSSGLKEGGAAAGAAATLGWAHYPASQAVSDVGLGTGSPGARDSLLAAGWAQRQQKQQQQASRSSPWVHTAANLAFKSASRTPPPPTTESVGIARQNSMYAARGAMTGQRPRSISSPQLTRELDTEQDDDAVDAPEPVQNNLSQPIRASTVSAGEAGSVPYTIMDRQMFTANPPVKPETDEQKRADMLHASALAMARKMYDPSRTHHTRSSTYPGHNTLTMADNEQPPTAMFTNLQEAAYRLAQERLAKLQDEHQKQRELQGHYSSPLDATTTTKRSTKLSKLLTRKRASSDGALLGLDPNQNDQEDRCRSERIRKQMTLLNSRLSEVDEKEKQRQKEEEEKDLKKRRDLLAAAQRNVRAQMQEMDDKLREETGRLPKGVMEDWGRKAKVAAQARLINGAAREMSGKVDVGGGRLVDREEVKRIAERKVRPVLEGMDERVEKERERRERERVEGERRREEKEGERRREREVWEIYGRIKGQQMDERTRHAEIKQEEKILKEEAKAIKAEQEQATKDDEKQQQPEPLQPTTTSPPDQQHSIQQDQQPLPPPPTEAKPPTATLNPVRALSIPFPKARRHTKSKSESQSPFVPQFQSKSKSKNPFSKGKHPEPLTSPTAPSSPPPTNHKTKVRTWLRARFPAVVGGGRARATSAASAPPAAMDKEALDDREAGANKRGFIGGVALARLQGRNVSSPSVHGLRGEDGVGEEVTMGWKGKGKGKGKRVSTRSGAGLDTDIDGSMREVAMAGRCRPGEDENQMKTAQPPSTPPDLTALRPVSQVSIPASDVSKRSVSSLGSVGTTTTDSSGDDKFVEARSELSSSPSPHPVKLSPPRAGGPMAGRVSPFRESKFSEILE